ncbi:MAG: Ubiquitin fusion degradation protein 4 [Alectoria sarmentosa]|nr:MAG: Ubiquitin fusion degradation protein 4 [Alectoria sarmentosa]CAD6580691.1 MAG: Ubiquitin fusion degradation protein 4 [Alectoria sarmentosa]
MSSRVTRSATKLAAESSSAAATPANTLAGAQPLPKSRKRKTPPDRDPSPDITVDTNNPTSPRRAKKQKIVAEASSTPTLPKSRRRGAQQPVTMAKPGPSSGNTVEKEKSPPIIPDTSRRKPSRKPESSSLPTTSTKRSKKAPMKKTEDVVTKGTDETPKNEPKPIPEPPKPEDSSDDDDDDGEAAARRKSDEEDDEGDPFRGGYLGGNVPHASMSSTLRALSGYVSGVSQRLRDILNNLRQKDDPSVQLIALQELSEILLVSNEDNLSGHFSPDQFIKELVTLMQPSEYGEENAEIMLLACRCIANLMEALPPSTANVVYGGAVPILCQKLLEIHFIDLAEQALSTLEKISAEFPSAIVREGGLTACLTYLDFFATSTQRTAVTTAANCCKNIPHDSFPVIKVVMPILLNVLSSSDQKVVEQGSICVSRVVESFKYQQDKLEELVSINLLKAIRRLLQPGTTNLIGPNIHTQFLRVLSITARASPRLSAELLKMDIVDTLYQILTGVSPPSGLEDVSSQIDSVFIMQALIHRPREQISETLNVICELLPEVQTGGLSFQDDSHDAGLMADGTLSHVDLASRSSHNSKRVELLEDCQEELKRFAIVLFPTLTDAYSSTVNLVVRQKVLLAQLKMVSNLDASILEDSLRTVPYASYLASILSQEDHPSLVTSALKASDLLLNRLSSIYGYQFYREGVMAEVSKLASKTMTKIEHKPKFIRADENTEPTGLEPLASKVSAEQPNDKVAPDAPSEDDSDHDEDDEEDDANDDDDDDEPREIGEDISPSPSDSSSSSQNYPMHAVASDHDLNVLRAKKFLEVHETTNGKTMHGRASAILEELMNLAADIENCYSVDEMYDGAELFTKLAKHFQGDALETITSSELLHSEIVRVLLDVFSSSTDGVSAKARTTFLEVFMVPSQTSTSQSAPPTPFSVFVHKLQDLLSRAEHFEVVTVHHNSLDNNRSSPAAMLSKQLRLKLMAADDNAEMPRPYKNLMISIHAIATFKALDDYLRPRISLTDRPRSGRHREGVSNALAAFAAAAGIPNPHHRLAERGGTASGDSLAHPIPSDPATPARATRKGPKSKNATVASVSTPVKDKPTPARRSSRKHQPVAHTPPDAPAPAPERVQSPLECADERQISDEDDVDDSSALDAIVDDLDDGMEGEQAPEPTAVNMEIASTGKVTARKEDGTRVATPSQGSGASLHGPPSARSREFLAAGINPSSSGRTMSYAAAIQAVPQDWHIEFSINGQPLPNETTIYGAVLNNVSEPVDPAPRNIWSAIHTVNFKRVSGPPPAESTSLKFLSGAISTAKSGMPPSLNEHPATSKILRLLNILHEMNANLDDVLDDSEASIDVKAEPVAQFVNTKLTAKLNRQLEEPLIVASNCLPSWSEDLARLYPFLFPFETRHMFLQSTSFGYARSMTRWQNQSAEENRRERHRDDRPFMGRLQRQKVRISRSRMLDSAMKVMELYGGSSSVLEVEYFEEVGTGLGPTLEFYSTVSKEFSKKGTKLWRENDANENDEYAFGKLGMFPAPMDAEKADSEAGKKMLNVFKMLGKFIARSMLDSRIIDVSLNPTFFRIGDQPSTVPLSLGAVKTVDSHLAKSLKLLKQYANAKREIDGKSYKSASQKAQAERKVVINGAHIEDLGLDFTLPGYPAIELISDGGNTPVNLENVASYVEKVIDMTLGSGVQKQVDHFRLGFSEVFPYTALKAFTPSELVMLFGRVEEDWSIETLLDSIKADHGFNMDSKSVRNLLQTMSELSAPQRRDFLQFVTGSPKLPIGGFKSLNPMFTVVCKPSEPPYTSDDFLISVMTCANYVKLPDYTNIDVLRKRLLTAIQEGQGAFHLS